MCIMKQILFFSALTFCCILSAFGQTGYVSEKLKMKSNILGRDVNYSIYLPADYNLSEINYPVLYLLHGYTADHT